MEIVIADHIPFFKHRLSGIDRARVGGILAHVINLVVFHYMLLPIKIHGEVGRVMDFVMADRRAHSPEVDCGLVGRHDAAVILNVVIDDIVFRMGQGRRVAALNIEHLGAVVVGVAITNLGVHGCLQYYHAV